MIPHLYTEEEANALLPTLIPILEELRRLVRDAAHFQRQLAMITPAARSNGQAPEALALEVALMGVQERFGDLVSQLEDFGVELKDVETGLIDFRSIRDGREVYLCWRLGEDRIRYWHELSAGFRGRQPL
ncbi:MAG: DUF2203 domain-containing protein [Chloroflexi bacterium]|nr:DUF2203 domain-containing protein [Chloroflexota bacterium]